MSVVVTKEGDQPAKITVKRNNDTWEVTEKDLDSCRPMFRCSSSRCWPRHARHCRRGGSVDAGRHVFAGFGRVPSSLLCLPRA